MDQLLQGIGGQEKRVTLQDVAKAAHVATSTVSRALNQPGRINPDTEMHVRKVADDLGYVRPDEIWRHRHKATQHIAVMVEARKTEMLSGIQSKLVEHHYLPVLYPTDAAGGLQSLQRTRDLFDGVISDIPAAPGRLILEIPSSQPLVVTNQVLDTATCVIPDLKQGIDLIVSHLQSLRHKSLSLIYNEKTWLGNATLNMVQRACARRDLSFSSVDHAGNRLKDGMRAVSRWYREPSSAVLVLGSYSALGFVQELQQLGISVPDDVSVVAVGDKTVGGLSAQRLSTLELPERNIGREAVRQLLTQIRSHDCRREAKVKTIPMKFINRDTTAFFSD